MIRSRLLTGLAILGLLLIGKMAHAADPVGTWTVDKASLRVELLHSALTTLAKMPVAEREPFEASLAAHVDEMMNRVTATMEFRPDGAVVVAGLPGKSHAGQWKRQGDGIHLMSWRDRPYVGPIEGDTMRLRAEVGDWSGDEIILKRR